MSLWLERWEIEWADWKMEDFRENQQWLFMSLEGILTPGLPLPQKNLQMQLKHSSSHRWRSGMPWSGDFIIHGFLHLWGYQEQNLTNFILYISILSGWQTNSYPSATQNIWPLKWNNQHLLRWGQEEQSRNLTGKFYWEFILYLGHKVCHTQLFHSIRNKVYNLLNMTH